MAYHPPKDPSQKSGSHSWSFCFSHLPHPIHQQVLLLTSTPVLMLSTSPSLHHHNLVQTTLLLTCGRLLTGFLLPFLCLYMDGTLTWENDLSERNKLSSSRSPAVASYWLTVKFRFPPWPSKPCMTCLWPIFPSLSDVMIPFLTAVQPPWSDLICLEDMNIGFECTIPSAWNAPPPPLSPLFTCWLLSFFRPQVNCNLLRGAVFHHPIF